MNMNKLDISRFDVPQINDLTWEVIEARGIPAGDHMALWEIVVGISEMYAFVEERDNAVAEDLILEGSYDAAQRLHGESRVFLGYMMRDAQELLKFLHKHGFTVPSEWQ